MFIRPILYVNCEKISAIIQTCFSDIAKEETQQAASQMPGLIEDLGVSCMPDASPSTM